MNLKEYCVIDDAERRRIRETIVRYKALFTDPDHCEPMIIVSTPVEGIPVWEEVLADPMVMLKAELDKARPHLEIGDDRLPIVRVQFGTAQVAAAFGCEMFVPPNSLPCAGSHVLHSAEEIANIEKPPVDAGWYGKLHEWTAIWKENLPDGFYIQHPDIQSPFNSAHLIRGNDILTDFFDHPDEVCALLDMVTDFMIDEILYLKPMLSDESGWFMDWDSMWKGSARISNCSMHMISPGFYRDFVLERDVRFFNTVGGGRMHYCGTAPEVIDEFFKVEQVTGLDVDTQYHDFFELCDKAPPRLVVRPTGGFSAGSDIVKRLLAGEWPEKRNIIVQVYAKSIEEGKQLMERLKNSIPR